MVQTTHVNLAPANLQTNFILEFEQINIHDIPRVGGKNASLGEMIQQLSPQGVRVPTGFATTAYAYRYFIEQAGLETQLRSQLTNLDIEDVTALRHCGRAVRSLILDTPFPAELATAIAQAYRSLCNSSGNAVLDVAVRSSATAEDLPDASFAGQQETYLNVHGF